jgi:hypothetical protein
MMADMFRVPVYKVSVTPWDEIKTKILSHLQDSEYRVVDNLTTDYKGPYPHDKEYDAPVYDILKPFINDITTQIGVKPPKEPPNMWSQKYYTGSEHTVHNHGNRGYSFILYLKFNPLVHKATRFYAPFDNFFTGEMLTWVPPDIQEGDLIAFPSAIKHTSQYQTSDEERMILSFNLFHPVGWYNP